MRIIHHLTIDMVRPLPEVPVDAVQGDGSTRTVELTLLENGAPWTAPEGITAAVAFRKADGNKGLYDTLPDGSKAVTFSKNTVSAVLAPQTLSCPGETQAAVVFYDSKLNQLATFPFMIRVAANPAAGKAISNDYYRYSTMEEISHAVEAALLSIEDRLAEAASAIVCEAVGQTVTVTDAAGQHLKGLSVLGKTVQNGTPTPENPVELESVGSSGTVTVSIAGGQTQTLNALTPNGLPGIPVSSGGNYTDEQGQQWLCDEVDFARGVYVQRIETKQVKMPFVQDGNGIFRGNYAIANPISAYPALLCNRFMGAANYNDLSANDLRIGLNSSGTVLLNYKAFLGNASGLNEWAANNPIYLLYPQKTPSETPLSAEELAQYAALRTNMPNTTVFNDSGAGMKLRYVADTKAYIDRKLAAISAALLNN